LNGKAVKYTLQQGYAVIETKWKKGDVVMLDLPMPVRRVVAIDSVKADQGRVALQRGPLVYCVENPDNTGKMGSFIVPGDAVFHAAYDKNTLGGVVVITSALPVLTPDETKQAIKIVKQPITAIPYFSWDNRGNAEMQVWLPVKIGSVAIRTGNGED